MQTPTNYNKKKRILNILLLVSIVIFTTCFFCLTILVDNKYSIKDDNEQVFYSNNKLTLVSDTALSSITPVLYWQFYDGLVAPEDMNTTPSKLIKIGDYSNFDVNDNSKSCGTYRATIWSYSEDDYISIQLYLPEVLSSYNVYYSIFNEKLNKTEYILAHSLGQVNSNKYFYKPYIQNQSITITFKGNVDIVIQVANFTHYYGGIYYPPLISGVNMMQSYTMRTTAIYSLIFAIALIVSAFAFYIYKIKKETPFLYASLLSLSFAIYIFYPIFHVIGTSHITFMYTIENLATMAISTFMLLICTSLMKKNIQVRTLNTILFVCCLIIMITSTFVHYTAINNFFQIFSLVVRIAIALYLVALSIICVIRENKMLIVFVANIVYACGLLFDTFVASYYDPYYFLYPIELGTFASILLFLYLALNYNSKIAKENKKLNTNLINEVTSRTNNMRNLIAERRDFVSSVAHDLKSPITSLSLFTQKLREEKLTNKEKEKIYEVMDDKLKTLSESLTIVQNFNNLDLIEDKLEVTDMCKLLKNFCESFAAEAEAEGVYFTYKIPIGTKINAIIPRQKFERAIQNILFNALSFTSENGNITLKLWATTEKLFIEIQDDGIGMTQEVQEHIFEKFFSYREKTTNGQFTSDGLGLYYTKLVIEECNGDITVNSQYEVGSTFTISLPIIN